MSKLAKAVITKVVAKNNTLQPKVLSFNKEFYLELCKSQDNGQLTARMYELFNQLANYIILQKTNSKIYRNKQIGLTAIIEHYYLWNRLLDNKPVIYFTKLYKHYCKL